MAAARTAHSTLAGNTSSPERVRRAPIARLAGVGLALCAILAAVPVAAQSGTVKPAVQQNAGTPAGQPTSGSGSGKTSAKGSASEPTLKDLVPDSAITDAKTWAANGNSVQGANSPPAKSGPAPSSTKPAKPESAGPLQPTPPLTAPNPAQLKLGTVQPLAPAAEPITFDNFGNFLTTQHLGSVVHLGKGVELVFPTERKLFPQQDAFVSRFKSLSTIETLSHGHDLARLAAQARSDDSLLQRMLRVYGYFNGQVSYSVEDQDGKPVARFDITPGPRYHFGTIDLGKLSDTGADYPALRQSFEIRSGDPLSLDTIVREKADLDAMLGDSGYPFAKLMAPSLVVDHEKRAGNLTMKVSPGGKYVFGHIISDMPHFLSGKHLQHLARWKPGQLYHRSQETDLRQAILATGIVGSVTLTPKKSKAPSGKQPGTVNIAAHVTKAPMHTIAGSLGYGTEEGVRLTGSWEDRDLFPPEGSLKLRGILGTQEQLAGITITKNNFHARDRILSVDAFAHYVKYTAYSARTLSLVTTYQRVSTLLFQKPLSYSAGLEVTASSERQADANGVYGPAQGYFVIALPTYGQIDTTDNLLDPTEGYRLALRLSPETSRSNGVQSYYLRSQFNASVYKSVSRNVVLAGRVELGSIPGAPTSAIAPSRRLYAGGGSSVRGYGYRAIGPRDTAGNPIGGRSLVVMSGEARIRTGLMHHSIGFVPFVDAGTVGDGPIPGFRKIQVGAGIGLRYYTNFGPIRIDVATPLNPGPNDPPIAVYVALGQAF